MQNLVGKRMLLKIATRGYGNSNVDEYKILELAPSGNWIKLQDINGRKYWKAATDVAVVEELKDLKIDKPTTV